MGFVPECARRAAKACRSGPSFSLNSLPVAECLFGTPLAMHHSRAAVQPAVWGCTRLTSSSSSSSRSWRGARTQVLGDHSPFAQSWALWVQVFPTPHPVAAVPRLCIFMAVKEGWWVLTQQELGRFLLGGEEVICGIWCGRADGAVCRVDPNWWMFVSFMVPHAGLEEEEEPPDAGKPQKACLSPPGFTLGKALRWSSLDTTTLQPTTIDPPF